MTNASAHERLTFSEDYVFHTIQGEGRFVGVPSVFVRLSGCNLRCTWQNAHGSTTLCDTPYASHHPDRLRKTIAETAATMHSFHCRHVVITGGEPFVQKRVAHLVSLLVDIGHHVTIETNGTIYLPTQAQFLSISPKLSSSIVPTSPHFAMHEKRRLNLAALAQLVRQEHHLKFVVNAKKEVAEILDIVRVLREMNGAYDESNILLMPQAISVPELNRRSRRLIEICKQHDWRFCDRLHIRLWGKKRAI
jgi:7-carboxy-7-deazaguanine synthase